MKMTTTATLMAALLSITPAAFAKPSAIDATQSSVRWTGKKVIGDKHVGTVAVKSGQVEFDGNNLKGGEVVIDMTSIKNEDVKDAGYNAKLTGHLKSDDFFGVDKNPTANFKITSVKALKGGKDATHEIKGDLTIKGTTLPVTFPAKVEVKDGTASAKGKLSVDRTKYGIRYGSGKFFENLGDKMISDEFDLEIELKSKL